MKISIQAFGGVSPRTNPRYLPPTASQVALNVEAYGQSVKPLKGLASQASANTLSGSVQTIYRGWQETTALDKYWLSSAYEVDVVRSQIAGDPWEWTFYSNNLDDGVLEGTNSVLALYDTNTSPTPSTGVLPRRYIPIGLPAPDEALTGYVEYVTPETTAAEVVLTAGVIGQMTTWNFDTQVCDVQVSIDKGQNWFYPTTAANLPANPYVTMTAAHLTALLPGPGIGISLDGLATTAAWGAPETNSQAHVIDCINTLIKRSGSLVATASAVGADVRVTANAAGGGVQLVVFWHSATGEVKLTAQGTSFTAATVAAALLGQLKNTTSPGYNVTGSHYLTATAKTTPAEVTVSTKPYCTIGSGADPSKTDRQTCEAAGGIWTDNGEHNSLWVRYGPRGDQVVKGQGTTENKGSYESRVYVFTWFYTPGAESLEGGWNLTMESAPSPVSEVVNVYADSKVHIRRYSGGTCSNTAYTTEQSCLDHFGTWTPSGLVAPAPGYTVTGLRLYRSVNGVYLLVAEGSIDDEEFIDDRKASQLGEPCPSIGWSHPPTGLKGVINLANGMVAGFKDRDVFICEPYRPYAWPESYINTLDHPIVGLGRMDTTLAVLTTGVPYFIQGANPASMVVVKSDIEQSCVAKRSIVSMGGAVIYASPDGLVVLTPGGSSVLTEGLFRREDWQDLPLTSLRAWGHDNKYVAFHDEKTIGGVVYNGFMVDLKTKQFVRHNISGVTAGYQDLRNDHLFLAKGGTLWRWEEGPNLLGKWRSKVFGMPQITGLSCAQVEAEAYDANLKCRIYRDGVKHETDIGTLNADVLAPDTSKVPYRLTGRDPFRLKAVQGRDWEIELDVSQEVFNVVLAQAPAELAEA